MGDFEMSERDLKLNWIQRVPRKCDFEQSVYKCCLELSCTTAKSNARP
jgi:hypothetical protein